MTTPKEVITAESFIKKVQERISDGMNYYGIGKECFELAKQYSQQETEQKQKYALEWSAAVEELEELKKSLQQNKSEVRGREFAEKLREKLAYRIKDALSLGREGCTYGDTNYDSLSACYGEKVAYEDVLSEIEKFLSSNPIESPAINPIGYLKNGKYYSFEQMQGETNDERDIIQPLYANPIAVEGEEAIKMKKLGEGFVKKVLAKYTQEEISFGRLVELLNEKVVPNMDVEFLAKEKGIVCWMVPVSYIQDNKVTWGYEIEILPYSEIGRFYCKDGSNIFYSYQEWNTYDEAKENMIKRANSLYDAFITKK